MRPVSRKKVEELLVDLGLSMSEFGRRAGLDSKGLERLFSGNARPKTILRAAKALGRTKPDEILEDVPGQQQATPVVKIQQSIKDLPDGGCELSVTFNIPGIKKQTLIPEAVQRITALWIDLQLKDGYVKDSLVPSLGSLKVGITMSRRDARTLATSFIEGRLKKFKIASVCITKLHSTSEMTRYRKSSTGFTQEEIEEILSLYDQGRILGTDYGGSLYGADLRRFCLAEKNLSDADLRRVNLSDVALTRADLSRADLRGSILIGTDLSDATMPDADLSGSLMFGTNFCRANMTNVKMRDAVVVSANLSDARVDGLDLSGTKIVDSELPMQIAALIANRDTKVNRLGPNSIVTNRPLKKTTKR